MREALATELSSLIFARTNEAIKRSIARVGEAERALIERSKKSIAHDKMIFVIDDDTAVRDSVRGLLEMAGHLVEDFSSAEAFLGSTAPSERDCVIVADIHLGGMSGIELFEKLRADGNPIAIILITARISPAMVAQAQTAGVLAVLEKPFRAAELLKAVKDATKP